MRRSLSPFMLCLIMALCIAAQPRAQQKDYYFTRLTEKDGLTDNHISRIVQDNTGFIWIATYYGLNRYDGYSFDRFVNNPADTTTISDNYITCLAVDKQGIVWVGTAKGGLNRYNPATKTFTHFRHDVKDNNSLYSDEIEAVYVDCRNRVWAGYIGEGWTVYDQEKKTFTSFRSHKVKYNAYARNMYNVVEGFKQDNNGNMWIASNAALYCQNMSSNLIITYRDSVRNNNDVADNLFTNMYMPGDSVIWLTTWAAGLKKFNIKTHTFTQYIFDTINPYYGVKNILLETAPKSPGELWVASADKGLGIFNITSGNFKFIPNNPSNANSPFPKECNVVFTDAQGSLWAGFNHGIVQWCQQSSNFRFFALTAFVPKYGGVTTNCFYKDTAAGLLYTGGDGGKGLYIINERTGKQEVIPFPETREFQQDNFAISSIARIDDDRLLILAFNGLNVYNTKTKNIQKLQVSDQEGRQPGNGYGLVRGFNNTWWYTSYGIYKIDSSLTKAYHYYDRNIPALKNAGALLLAENDSTIWLNDNISGLEIFNSISNQAKPVKLSNGNFSIVSAVNALPAGNNNYWVTSFDQGLYKLTKNNDGSYTYRHFGNEEGIPVSFAKGIVRDRNNNYWVTTRKGAVIYNTRTKHFKLFSEEDGFKAESWYFDDLYASQDGYVYFTTAGGYARTNIDSLHYNTQSSPVIITSLKAAGKETGDEPGADGARQIKLSYTQNFFTVEFALLNYIDPQKNKYAYMLSGVDHDFINCGTRRYVSYTDLAPGSYTLLIKAANNDGIWSNSIVKIYIVITPPFWRTWLFYCIVTICIAALVLVGYRYHINNIRKEEKLKTAFNKQVAEIEMKALRAQMNPHFIFNCLNSINRYIIKSDHVTASHYLTRFSKLIRLILDNSIADTTTLENEIQLIRLYIEMEQLRFEGKFTYSIETDDLLQVETIKIPSMLIQPYAENAIWHGLLHKEGSGHIFIRFTTQDENILRIEIEDDGVGREKSAGLKSKTVLKNKSYGMRITGDRINIVNQLYNMNASATVEDLVQDDGAAAGTRITLLIPFEQPA